MTILAQMNWVSVAEIAAGILAAVAVAIVAYGVIALVVYALN